MIDSKRTVRLSILRHFDAVLNFISVLLQINPVCDFIIKWQMFFGGTVLLISVSLCLTAVTALPWLQDLQMWWPIRSLLRSLKSAQVTIWLNVKKASCEFSGERHAEYVIMSKIRLSNQIFVQVRFTCVCLFLFFCLNWELRSSTACENGL